MDLIYTIIYSFYGALYFMFWRPQTLIAISWGLAVGLTLLLTPYKEGVDELDNQV